MEAQPNMVFAGSGWVMLAGSVAVSALLAAFFGWRAASKQAARAAQLELELRSAGHYVGQVETLKAELAEAITARIEAERARSVAEERAAAMKLRIEDWEAQRAESLQAARAAIMQAGNEMSSKLLEDHKRETLEARKESEKLSKKTTEELMEKFMALTRSVAAVEQRATEGTKQMEVVMRALSNPSGAGHFAEIGLENSLKALGLQKDRDFITQFHIAGEEQNLRPDAVVFLPQDLVMVIDSKASQFLVHVAAAEAGQATSEAEAKLLQTVHAHLTALTRKDYAQAVQRVLKERGKSAGRILSVMYLPSDAMLERMRAADYSLVEKAEKSGIILAGPASLMGLLSLARQQIAAARQEENQQQIIAVVREVMESFAAALVHVDGVGKGVQSTAKKLDDFVRSINRFLLPRLRKLEGMGVQPAKGGALPHALASYEIRRTDEVVTIDGDEPLAAHSALVDEREERKSA